MGKEKTICEKKLKKAENILKELFEFANFLREERPDLEEGEEGDIDDVYMGDYTEDKIYDSIQSLGESAEKYFK